MMKCEVEICTVRRDGYVGCDNTATRVSRYGHMYCEEHHSPADVKLDHKCKELAERLKFRRDTQEECEPLPNEDLSNESLASSTLSENTAEQECISPVLSQP